MKYMLQRRFNFPESSILMLTEDQELPDMKPTRENIKRALHWLVEDCEAGDSLVFNFSGHIAQQRNNNGDEIDGNDETLCPMDFQTKGPILDDEIKETIGKPSSSWCQASCNRSLMHATVEPQLTSNVRFDVYAVPFSL